MTETVLLTAKFGNNNLFLPISTKLLCLYLPSKLTLNKSKTQTAKIPDLQMARFDDFLYIRCGLLWVVTCFVR